jgi:hypothetical protein
MTSTVDDTDYFVFTSENGSSPNPWSWEIRRKSRPMGIKLSEGGFRSSHAADFAGKRALADFLIELAREEKVSDIAHSRFSGGTGPFV